MRMRSFVTVTAMLAFAAAAQAETVTVGINGLVCAFCVKGIEKSFMKQDAVAHVGVDLDHKQVTLTTKPGQTLDDATIRSTITDAGFTTTSIARQEQP